MSDIFAAIMVLAEALGVREINKLDGCWEVAIDEQWWMAVNGHAMPKACTHGPAVQPFAAYIEFNGFPAGIVTLYTGIIAAGSEANEHVLIEAIHDAAKRARS